MAQTRINVICCVRRVCVFGILLAFLHSAAFAQLAPGLGYVFPPAIRIGSETPVQLGGFDLTPDVQWFVHDAHVRLEVTGPAGDFLLPPPPYWLGPRGGTPALPIPREVPAVIHVAPEASPGLVRWQVANANGSSKTAMMLLTNETEVVESRSRDLPQSLPSLPVSVSGRLSRLTEVDHYTVRADHDGPVTVTLMARQLGSDFRGIVSVHDEGGTLLADFADTLGTDGQLQFEARAGQSYQVRIHDVDFRGDRAYVYRLSFTQSPAAEIADDSGAPVRRLEDAPVANGLIDLTSEAVIIGRYPIDTELPDFVFQLQQNDMREIDLQSAALGGNLDLILTLMGPDGQTLQTSEDYGGTPDCHVDLTAATAGTYRLVCRSQSTVSDQPGNRFRLQIRTPEPDFRLTMPQQLSLPSGGSTEVAVSLRRIGSFTGDVTLQLEGLPSGVTQEGMWIIPAGQTECKGILKHAADAGVTAAVLHLNGKALINGTEVIRPVMSPAAGMLAPRTPDQTLVHGSLLAITMPAPIDVLVVDRERQRDVPRGTTYLAELDIVRRDGFDGEVAIEMSAQQARNRQGIRGSTTVVSPGQTRALFPCFMPEWLATDITRRMVVHGIVRVPDAVGREHYLTKPGDARITMIMEGALMKLAAETREFHATAGDAVSVPVQVSRTARLPLEARIQLLVPDEISGLIHSEPLTIPADQTQGVLRIQSVPDSRLAGLWKLRIAATALQNEQWPVVSEAEVEITFASVEDRPADLSSR